MVCSIHYVHVYKYSKAKRYFQAPTESFLCVCNTSIAQTVSIVNGPGYCYITQGLVLFPIRAAHQHINNKVIVQNKLAIRTAIKTQM